MRRKRVEPVTVDEIRRLRKSRALLFICDMRLIEVERENRAAELHRTVTGQRIEAVASSVEHSGNPDLVKEYDLLLAEERFRADCLTRLRAAR